MCMYDVHAWVCMMSMHMYMHAAHVYVWSICTCACMTYIHVCMMYTHMYGVYTHVYVWHSSCTATHEKAKEDTGYPTLLFSAFHPCVPSKPRATLVAGLHTSQHLGKGHVTDHPLLSGQCRDLNSVLRVYTANEVSYLLSHLFVS